MELTVKTLGGIDLLINDASAIRLAGTLETTTQHFESRSTSCGRARRSRLPAIRYVAGGEEVLRHSRTVDIMADAADVILTQPAARCSGNFFIDETVLREHGVANFDRYANTPGVALHPDLFL
jgi:hypothetical protein